MISSFLRVVQYFIHGKYIILISEPVSTLALIVL